MNSRRIALATLITCVCTPAFAECNGVVKVTGSSIDGDNVVLNIRVYATDKTISRTVYYTLSGEVRINTNFGANLPAIVYVVNSTLVDSGHEYADDDITYYVGHPITLPKIKDIVVSGCYPQ